MKTIEDFLKPTQKQLFKMLAEKYTGCTANKDNYILVEGNAPLLLVAHLDTVHKEPVRVICKSNSGNILMSPQGIGGDDRCGVYALASVYEQAKNKPWLLFTCNEEIGGVGAETFTEDFMNGILPTELVDLKAIIEIDRKGKNDAVYYDCVNYDFENYITEKGFSTAFGSFSDISVIAPVLGIAAVNLSSGYYYAHTLYEYINKKHLDATIHRVLEMVEDASKEDFPKYEYASYDWEDWGHGNYSLCDTPKDLPKKYKKTYGELLDYYTYGEIESYRRAYGNEILNHLYNAVYNYDGR